MLSSMLVHCCCELLAVESVLGLTIGIFTARHAASLDISSHLVNIGDSTRTDHFIAINYDFFEAM